MIVLPGGVEAALGGALLALFGDDAGGVGPVGERDREHFLGRRHLEVQRQVDLGHQPVDVAVGDVAPVLAQVGGDAVGAGRGGGMGRAHRVGMIAAARVPDGRDMVDIDAEAEAAGSCRGAAPRLDRGDGGELGRKRIGLVGRHVEPDQRRERHAEVGRAARAVDQGGRGDDDPAGRARSPRSPRATTGRW